LGDDLAVNAEKHLDLFSSRNTCFMGNYKRSLLNKLIILPFAFCAQHQCNNGHLIVGALTLLMKVEKSTDISFLMTIQKQSSS
jgi:hypothetical protein